MRLSSKVPFGFGLLAVAACGLCACATRPPGDVALSSIKLDDDPMVVASVDPAPPAKPGRRPAITTPIAQIIAYPGGRQVLDQDLPGLTTRPEYCFFQNMSLKTLQGMSRGRLKDDDIRKVAADLRALP